MTNRKFLDDQCEVSQSRRFNGDETGRTFLARLQGGQIGASKADHRKLLKQLKYEAYEGDKLRMIAGVLS